MLDVICICGCERNRHHKETVSSGDVTNPASREPQYFACLVMNCDGCKRFTPRIRDKSTGG